MGRRPRRGEEEEEEEEDHRDRLRGGLAPIVRVSAAVKITGPFAKSKTNKKHQKRVAEKHPLGGLWKVAFTIFKYFFKAFCIFLFYSEPAARVCGTVSSEAKWWAHRGGVRIPSDGSLAGRSLRAVLEPFLGARRWG